MHHFRLLEIGSINAVSETAKFDHGVFLPHFSNLWVGMPQQVAIFHCNACLRIDDIVGARRPALRFCMCDRILYVDKVLEDDVAEAIPILGSCG